MKKAKRYYGAVTNNIYYSWQGNSLSADRLIKQSLSKLRNRARDLERNNPHAGRFLELLRHNVVGNGFVLQNKAAKKDGSLDTEANKKIEKLWKEFCKKGNADVTGEFSFTELCNQIITTVARDGEILIRVIKPFGKFGISLQLLEGDHLDENYNDEERGIKLSIKRDSWGRPVSYFVLKNHPDTLSSNNEKIEIPAKEIFHLYKKDRPSQSRGVTWLHTVMNSMQQYDKFAEATIVDKRVSASKMGFYIRPEDEDVEGAEVDEDGNLISEVTPGQFGIIPAKWDFKTFDPKSSSDDFADFGKAILKNIATGLSVSYNTFANDLEGVNFSSIRAGLISERDHFKSLQLWMIEQFLEPFFIQWLEMQFVMGNLSLNLSMFERYAKPLFLGRGFAWVDPLKDTKANIDAINNGLKTVSQVLSEQGGDLEEVYEQLAKEKELREKYNLQIGVNNENKTTV